LDQKELISFLNSLEDYGIPGCDCIVYLNHKPVFRYMTGYADKEKTKPINEGTYFWIYSVTKLVTCAAVMQLVENGIISLDDPVYLYLPEYKNMKVKDGNTVKPAENIISIRHLMSMRSGMNYNISAPSILRALKETNGQASTLDIIKALAHEPLDFEPGTRFQYSLSHDVLAAVIEVASGKSFDAYIQDHILQPLGMHKTGFELTEEKRSAMADQFLYNVLSRSSKPVSLNNDFVFSPNYKSGGAGLISTTDDFILFLDAMCNGGVGANGSRILSKESIDLIRTDQLNDKARDDYIKMDWNRCGYSYGLGCRVLIDKTLTEAKSPLGEFGWDGAAGASAIIDADNHVAVFYVQHVLACDFAYKTIHRRVRDLTYEMLQLAS
jgi:CubicO group peptidase (beta-lactamase class C family)